MQPFFYLACSISRTAQTLSSLLRLYLVPASTNFDPVATQLAGQNASHKKELLQQEKALRREFNESMSDSTVLPLLQQRIADQGEELAFLRLQLQKFGPESDPGVLRLTS